MQRNNRKNDDVKPNFDKETCETYFKNVLKQRNSDETFQLQTWEKKLETPHTVFNLEPPSYKEITKIINKTK